MTVKGAKLLPLTRGVRLHQYLDDWLSRARCQEEAQTNTQTMLDLTQSLGWIINQEKSKLEPTQMFFVRGLRIPTRFSPCKTHSREMAQTSGFYPTHKVKACFDCKMFDVANWLACLNKEDGPRGTPLHESLSVSFQGVLEISSVIGHPLSLVRDDFSSPRALAKPCKCDEGYRSSLKDHNIQILQTPQRLGCSLRDSLYKRSVVRKGKKATLKCSRVEGSISVPEKVQGLVSKSKCWLLRTI